ncbi:capsid cement protein [Pseudovibrio sp. SPO723]|uniref:capsid cement protein n=1 Tax=Nesiotobacter zosterae TaxID=392721 RepID=UPI0029C4B97F|nr:capsid cement protein [Pseudovibrio sp. SPO723]MDX5595312.1 capsid cement protein [Pseudovibrio sp. SPO723]
MQQFGLIKNFTSQGATEKYRLIAPGTKGGHTKCAALDEKILGTSGVRGAKDGERLDVYLDGIRPVTFGGDVAFGDPLTSDAQGRAIKAEPASGVTIAIGGHAMCTATAGAVGDMHVLPGYITG